MNKRQIVLTEQDLHFLVENAVKTYLVENDMEEGLWGGLKNSARSLFNGNFDNLAQAYSQGSWASTINKYYQTAQNGLKGMQQIMNKSGDQQGASVIQQIIQNLGNVVQNYQQVAANTSNKSNMRLRPRQNGVYNNYNMLNNGLGTQKVKKT